MSGGISYEWALRIPPCVEADALALLHEALGPKLAKHGALVLEDPDGWGLTDPTTGIEEMTGRAVAEHVLGCMASDLYTAADTAAEEAGQEWLRATSYAAVSAWLTEATQKLAGAVK